MTVKRIIVVVSSLTIFVAGIIVADYFALFGTQTEIKLDFVEARFRTLDAETNAIIMDVGVRCFQKNNNNVCTRKESGSTGIVSVNMPVKRVIKKTLLFIISDEYIKAPDPNLHIMFIHNDYYKSTESVLLEDIYSDSGKEYTTHMKAHRWETDEQGNE